MENFQYLQFEFNLDYQNLNGSCEVTKRKCLVRLEADSFNRVRGQERAIATMMFYKSIVADLIVHHKQHHRQGRDDEKQSCSGPASHIMLLDDGEQHRSVTHYYDLNVAHMTGTPDGFYRKMLGEDLIYQTSLSDIFFRMYYISLNFAVTQFMLCRDQWPIARSSHNSQRW